MNIRNWKKDKKGFSLYEMLVVVAIIVITFSLGAVGVHSLRAKIEQTKLDNMAQTIYVTAQNNLTKLNSAGRIYQVAYDANDNQMANYGTENVKTMVLQDKEPIDFDASFYNEDEDTVEAKSYSDYILTALYSENDRMVLLVPDEAIDSSGYAHWIVEYDTNLANVYAVFYSEVGLDFYSSDADVDKIRSSKEDRIEYGATVGYYGGFEKEKYKDGSSDDSDKITSDIYVENGEELYAYFTVNMPKGAESHTISLTANVYGNTSNVTSKDITVKDGEIEEVVGTGSVRKYKLLLDRLDNSFTDNSLYSGLLPGENITISLTVKDTTEEKDDVKRVVANKTTPVTCNSLYDSLTEANASNTNNTAYIRYVRHLQNLHIYGMSENVDAIQVRDIDFTNARAGEYRAVYTADQWQYIPIDVNKTENFKIMSYNGQGYKIENLTADKTVGGASFTSAGLFGIFRGTDLKNIIMVNTDVKGTVCAGALAGVISSNAHVNINNCYVYLGTSKYANKNAASVQYIKGQISGGLVGQVSGTGSTFVTSSFASTVIQGSVDCGGLIGRTDSAYYITESYADSYLLTSTNGYVAGLVATSSSVEGTITDSYVAGFVITNAKFGAGFTTGITASVTNSYSILSTRTATIGTGYSLVKSSKVMKNSYYVGMENLAATTGATAKDLTSMEGLAKTLGSKFRTDPTKNTTVPYNMSTLVSGLEKYPYPTIASITTITDSKTAILNHYGDWFEKKSISGELGYYEVYSDGTAGYEVPGESTLDSTKDIVYDGYALVYTEDDYSIASLSKHVDFYGNGFDKAATVSADITNYEKFRTSKGYYFFKILPTSILNASNTKGYFYQQIDVESTTYYFNPGLAKSVITSETEAQGAPMTAYVRTPRHLYSMSLYYDSTISGNSTDIENFVPGIDSTTYLQERKLDYTAYDWDNECVGLGNVSSQKAIGSNTNKFISTYEGDCYIITGVSYTQNESCEAGLFGHTSQYATVRDVILSNDYIVDSSSNRTVSLIANNVASYEGSLVAYNEGFIYNCASDNFVMSATTSSASTANVGGLVGRNTGSIYNSSSDIPKINVEVMKTTSNYIGGFTGYNSGTIGYSYCLSAIEIERSISGNIYAGGFAAYNIYTSNSYAITYINTDDTAAGIYGFVPNNNGTATNCYYITDGLYSYCDVNHTYSFDQTITYGYAMDLDEMKALRINGFSTVDESHSYDHRYSNKDGQNYPFVSAVQNKNLQYVHYGNWVVTIETPVCGMYYWEIEEGKVNYYILDNNANVYDTLCYSHHDNDSSHIVGNYGYGYFIEDDYYNKNTNVFQNATVTNPETKCWNSEYMFTNGKPNLTNEATYDNGSKKVSDSIKTSTGFDNYYFFSYESNVKDDGTYGLYAKNLDFPNLVFDFSSIKKNYEYTFVPFFAKDLGLKANGETVATITEYGVRSIAQLQALNWFYEDETNKGFDYKVSMATSTVSGQKYGDSQNFLYLSYSDPDKGHTKLVYSYVIQSHNIDGKGYDYTPIAARSIACTGTPFCFYGSYDGQNYLVMNVNIGVQQDSNGNILKDANGNIKFKGSDNNTTVALFGVVGRPGAATGDKYAIIKNVCMVNEDGNGVIARNYNGNGNVHDNYDTNSLYNYGEEWPPYYNCNKGSYYIGTIAGYVSYNSTVENCTSAGYTIYDNTVRKGTEINYTDGHYTFVVYGVGGLIGCTNSWVDGSSNTYNTVVKDCSADTKIIINSTNTKDAPYSYPCFASIGGLVGLSDGDIYDSYSGGSITLTDTALSDTNGGIYHTYFNIGGITGGKDITHWDSLPTWSSTLQSSMNIYNCYSYTDLPTSTSDLIESVAVIATTSSYAITFAGGNNSKSAINIRNCYYYARTSLGNPTNNFIKAPTSYARGSYFGVTGMSYDQMKYDDNGVSVLANSLSSNYYKDASRPVDVSFKYAKADGTYPTVSSLKHQVYPFPAIIRMSNYVVHFGNWPSANNGITASQAYVDLELFKETKDATYDEIYTYFDTNGEESDISAPSQVKVYFDKNDTTITTSDYVTLTQSFEKIDGFTKLKLTITGKKITKINADDEIPSYIPIYVSYNGYVSEINVMVSGQPLLRVIEDTYEDADKNIINDDLYEKDFNSGVGDPNLDRHKKTYTIELNDTLGKQIADVESDPIVWNVRFEDASTHEEIVDPYVTADVTYDSVNSKYVLTLTGKDDDVEDYVAKNYRFIISASNITNKGGAKSSTDEMTSYVTVYPVTTNVTVTYYDGTFDDANIIKTDTIGFFTNYTDFLDMATYAEGDNEAGYLLKGRKFKHWISEDGQIYKAGKDLENNIIKNVNKPVKLRAVYEYYEIILKDDPTFSDTQFGTIYCSNGGSGNHFFSDALLTNEITEIVAPTKAKYAFVSYVDATNKSNVLTSGDGALTFNDAVSITGDTSNGPVTITFNATWVYSVHPLYFYDGSTKLAEAQFETGTMMIYNVNDNNAFTMIDGPDKTANYLVFDGWYIKQGDTYVKLIETIEKSSTIQTVENYYNGSCWTATTAITVYAHYVDAVGSKVTLVDPTSTVSNKEVYVLNNNTNMATSNFQTISGYTLEGYYLGIYDEVNKTWSIDNTWTTKVIDKNGSFVKDVKFGTANTKVTDETTGAWIYGQTPATTITLYARWQHEVSFVTNCSTTIPSILVDHNATITDTTTINAISALTKEHYEYGGLYTNSSLTGDKFVLGSGTNATKVISNITLYVKWNSKVHNITFYKSDGTTKYAEAQYETDTNKVYIKGTYNNFTMIDGPTTTKDKAFDGWYIKENDTLTNTLLIDKVNKGSSIKTVSSYYDGTKWTATTDITVYAKYVDAVGTRVTLVDPTGSVDNKEIYILNDDTKATSSDLQSKTNYILEGYYLSTDWSTKVIDKDGNFIANTKYNTNDLTNASSQWVYGSSPTATTLTLYARWQHSVTFETNCNTTIDSIIVEHGATIKSIQTLTKDYYTFGGWYTDDSFNNVFTIGTTTITTNTTLYAKWTPITYTIGYVLYGGTNASSNPSTYNFETPTITLANPTKSGFTFDGWYLDETFNTKMNHILKGSNGNKTFYAKWTPITYTITYDTKGGTNHISNPSNYTILTSTITLKDATRTGYTFNGWYDSTTNEKVETIAIGSTGNKSLYAKWTPITYTITYDAKGGTNATTNPSSYTIESDDITLANPTRDCYTFDGWYDSSSNAKVEGVAIASGSTGDKSFYAKWTPITYTISYELNGGTISDDANPTTYNVETETITLVAATKTGYTFNGWYDSTTNEKVETITKGSSGDRSLYADWTATSYTITYNLDGGTNSSSNPSSYTIESDDITLADPTRDGHRFDGWFTESTFSNEIIQIAKGSTGDIELYAKWTKVWKVTLNKEIYINGTTVTNYPDGTTVSDLKDYPIVREVDNNIPYIKTWPEPKINNNNIIDSILINHYTFDAWYISKTSTKYSFTETNKVTGPVSLNANFNQADYYIKIKGGDGASNGSVWWKKSSTAWSGNYIDYTAPEKTGYILVGFKYNGTTIIDVAEDGTLSLASGASMPNDILNFEVEAIWKKTIKFNLNHSNLGTETVLDGTTVSSISLTKPTRSGWEFVGWYDGKTSTSLQITDNNGKLINGVTNKYSISSGSIQVEDSATGSVIQLYAKWSKKGQYFILTDTIKTGEKYLIVSSNSETTTTNTTYSYIGSGKTLVTINDYNGQKVIEYGNTYWSYDSNTRLELTISDSSKGYLMYHGGDKAAKLTDYSGRTVYGSKWKYSNSILSVEHVTPRLYSTLYLYWSGSDFVASTTKPSDKYVYLYELTDDEFTVYDYE